MIGDGDQKELFRIHYFRDGVILRHPGHGHGCS